MTPNDFLRRSAAAICLAAIGATASAATLRFRLSEDPETLYNVQTISLTAGGVIGSYLLERLVYVDAQGQPKPWLSESWSVSPDQKQVTFKLRKGVKFHDGTDFDAAAVKFHFDSIRDPKNASPLLPLLGKLTSVEVVDASTVTFSFSEPFAPFFNNLAQASMGFNSPKAVMDEGKGYGRKPVGTGPYKLRRWIAGTEIDLERYDGYRQWRGDAVNKGVARTENIVLRVIKEDSVATAALESGELSGATLQPDALARFAKDPAFKLITVKNPTNMAFLEFNQQRAPFNDPVFRQAIGYAIDRKAAVQAAWSGYGAPALGPLAAGIPGYDAALIARVGAKYDPVKARELLARSGWIEKNGVLEKNGQPARFTIRSYAGFDSITRTLAVVQSNLRAIGIDVKLETSDWGAFYPSLLKNDWDMDLMRWSWPDGAVLSNLFRSPGHRHALLPDAKLDPVLDRCNVTLEPAARNACLSEAQSLLIERETIVPVLSNWDITATQKEVQDYTVDAINYLIPGDIRLAP
jgi:peptide/nickel transport system substrate-binding protein